MADAVIFVSRFAPEQLGYISIDAVVRSCIAFIQNPVYIKNPYLRAKLVEIIYALTPEVAETTGIGASTGEARVAASRAARSGWQR